MQSNNLALPYIDGAQAQYYVTHNEALRVLDTLVQLAVIDRDLNAPPSTPAEGERWIVAATPTPTGAWTGRAHDVAAWQDGAWQFSEPRTGWLAYVIDEAKLVGWDGAAWTDVVDLTVLQGLARLGVGATADETNPFSATLNNALWTARTVADGGDGTLRYKMSKESAEKTLSLLMQTNFSGRAEIGLTGDDDLHIKVSPDGSVWREALSADHATGKITIAQGFADPPAARAQLYAAPLDALAFSGMQVNGGMQVSQEHGAASIAVPNATAVYAVDQTAVFASGTLRVSAQQVSDAPAGFTHSLKVMVTVTEPSLAATSRGIISQSIEGWRCGRLAWGSAGAMPMAVGVWLKASVAGTYGVSVSNAAANRSFVRTAVLGADVWTFVPLTFPGDSGSTWLADSGAGVSIAVCFAAGSSYQATADTWHNALANSSGAQTNLAATDGATLQMTGLVALPGLELPAAERSALIMRPFDQELMLCRRYFRRFGNKGSFNLLPLMGVKASVVIDFLFFAQTPMRAAPAFVHSSPAYVAGAPSGNQVAIYNNAMGDWFSITGTLSVGSGGAALTADELSMRFQAGTSWSGTNGDSANVYLGPSAFVDYVARL